MPLGTGRTGAQPPSPRAGYPDGELRLSLPATLHVSQHPAVLHKLGILRDESTEPKKSARSSASFHGSWATKRWPMPAFAT